ncbi:hypothetical protein KDU71_16575 [Carboxylicivirga sediminis]|uniref:Uncharacterized protein n=1 Tax=Carboxylicivirga sediminis TaxID=2006564 RepID=A0A941F648_9BACT|nr:hypothetical protein [Carboxylicivirga sediminis]MBR8537187.1 hypothetical protein [Carboxylicivirga sediminis]
MTISFNSNRLFRECVDAKLRRETYYRIDTVVSAMDDKKLYKIYYFDGEREQRFVFDFVNEKSGLFLYDIGCFDCASTHAFSRITD